MKYRYTREVLAENYKARKSVLNNKKVVTTFARKYSVLHICGEAMFEGESSGAGCSQIFFHFCLFLRNLLLCGGGRPHESTKMNFSTSPVQWVLYGILYAVFNVNNLS